VIGGDLAGAGLSSSAAVLICYLLGLARANRFDLDRRDVATLVQRAENSYIGVASGLLDQSIILFAGEGHLTHVNVSDLSVERVTAPDGAPEVGVVVAFSGISRVLAGSGFNTRVEECHEAARILLDRGGRAASRRPLLSEVEPEVFDRFAAELPDSLRRRAAHFFGERRRVIDGVEAWRRGDLAGFGELMSASGESSIRNYECGTPELVTLYELLRETPGVYGARFSGAGFGGSCVALADPAAGEEIADAVSRGYAAAHSDAAANAGCHLCTPAGPARFVDGDR
jgi:galactokinase/galacturonokinase